jgi:hypothetical protein
VAASPSRHVIHRCVACGLAKANRVADDPAQGDDIDALIAVMSNQR